MISAMVDIESLDTEKTAVIAQIGVVVFQVETNIIIDELLINVNVEAQSNRTISASTVNWWLKQDPAVIDSVFGSPDRKLLVIALTELQVFLMELSVEEFWSKGPDFDYGILANAMAREGMVLPWKYSQLRDYRTIAKTFSNIKAEIDNSKLHNALADAEHQTAHLLRILKIKGN